MQLPERLILMRLVIIFIWEYIMLNRIIAGQRKLIIIFGGKLIAGISVFYQEQHKLFTGSEPTQI